MYNSQEVAWKPNKDYTKNSNVKRFMDNHGIKTYKQLVKRSVDDIEWFWDAVVEDLNIEFYEPYEKVLDISAGIQFPKWFVSGKMNIAYNSVDKHKDRNDTAVIGINENGDENVLSYNQLYRETNKLANALNSLGVEKGDRVAIYMPMVPETVTASLACSKIGAIYTPVFSGYGSEAVNTRLRDSNSKVLITSDGFQRKGKNVKMKETADEAVLGSNVEHVIVNENIGTAKMEKDRDVYWNDVVSKQFDTYETELMDSEDPFMIIYTSGTTGKPKGAVHSHAGFQTKVAQEVSHHFDLKKKDLLYWTTDFGWIMGPWEVIGATTLGGKMMVYDGAINYPKPETLLDQVEKYDVSILGTSPTAVRGMMRNDDIADNYKLESLRVLGSTGEVWDQKSWNWYFEKIGKKRSPIINISGGTEVGACFLSPSVMSELKPMTLGGPALGMDIDVYNEDGRSVVGEEGELVCKQPWPGMTRSLWGDDKKYLETYWSRYKNTWVHGDLAKVDEDGHWFLYGRSDNIIKVAGKRIGPGEVEDIVTSYKGVSEAAAIGIPDEVKGESIVCFAVPGYEKLDGGIEDELKSRIGKKLGKSMIPSKIKIVGQLPKTKNGKILRRLIKNKYLGKELGDLTGVENPESLELLG